jgi:hypothetical protein
MSIIYERPTLDEEKRFMAKRIRNWIMKPESDPELTEIVKTGKIEALKVFLDDETEK